MEQQGGNRARLAQLARRCSRRPTDRVRVQRILLRYPKGAGGPGGGRQGRRGAIARAIAQIITELATPRRSRSSTRRRAGGTHASGTSDGDRSTSTSKASTTTGHIRSPKIASSTTGLTNYHHGAPAGALRPSLPIRVRLEIIAVYLADRWPRARPRAAMRHALRSYGVFTYLRDRRRARQPRTSWPQAARALRGRRPRRAGLRGDRDQRGLTARSTRRPSGRGDGWTR